MDPFISTADDELDLDVSFVESGLQAAGGRPPASLLHAGVTNVQPSYT